MKVVLFCGGLGTRIRDYSEHVPKPMVPIGGSPILAHVMDYYGAHDFRDFVLCLGHKGEVIKEHFSREAGSAATAFRRRRVQMVNTGVQSNIGERLWAVKDLLRNEDAFCANYADGLTDADLTTLQRRFLDSGKVAAFLAVRPPLSFHFADIAPDGGVQRFYGAAQADLWINGGYFFFRREIFDFMRPGEELVEQPFQRLREADALMAFKHDGFFRAMDTTKDRLALEEMHRRGAAPWLLRRPARMLEPQLQCPV